MKGAQIVLYVQEGAEASRSYKLEGWLGLTRALAVAPECRACTHSNDLRAAALKSHLLTYHLKVVAAVVIGAGVFVVFVD